MDIFKFNNESECDISIKLPSGGKYTYCLSSAFVGTSLEGWTKFNDKKIGEKIELDMSKILTLSVKDEVVYYTLWFIHDEIMKGSDMRELYFITNDKFHEYIYIADFFNINRLINILLHHWKISQKPEDITLVYPYIRVTLFQQLIDEINRNKFKRCKSNILSYLNEYLSHDMDNKAYTHILHKIEKLSCANHFFCEDCGNKINKQTKSDFISDIILSLKSKCNVKLVEYDDIETKSSSSDTSDDI